ncbi:MAG: type II secretion system F family protein [Candidatus Woesearchaeota archaeon]
MFFAKKFGKAFIPKTFRPNIKKFMLKAGFDDIPFRFFGYMFYASLFTTLLIYLNFVYRYLIGYSSLVVMVVSFVAWVIIQLLTIGAVMAGIYFFLNIRVYKRTKLIEEKLPDYLTLVSTNLKGGLSFEKSLWAAIKPEFEILAKEVTMVSKKVMTGNDLKDAMIEFSQKYDSPILRRTMELIISEIESGGRIVDVIDGMIVNLRKTKVLKAEMVANTLTYMMFIAVIVVIIAPALFALSNQLLTIMINFSSKLGNLPAATSLPVSFNDMSLDIVDDFRFFSVAALFIISLFSSMIISIIEKGAVKAGLKYIPLFVVGSIVSYFIFSAVLSVAFSGLVI